VGERGARVGRPGKEENGPGPRRTITFYLIDLIKRGSSHSQKNSKKYRIEGLEIRNNFSYWSFLKFGMKFELKIQGSSRV
jgi:hypothetical protein